MACLAASLCFNKENMDLIIKDNTFQDSLLKGLLSKHTPKILAHKNLVCFLGIYDINGNFLKGLLENLINVFENWEGSEYGNVLSILQLVLDAAPNNQSNDTDSLISKFMFKLFNQIVSKNDNFLIFNIDTPQLQNIIKLMINLLSNKPESLQAIPINNWQFLLTEIVSYLFNIEHSEEKEQLSNVLSQVLIEFVKILCNKLEGASSWIIDNYFLKTLKQLPEIPFRTFSTQIKGGPELEKSEAGFVGIRNPGCICYMNAVLQQLFFLPTFRTVVLWTSDEKSQNLQQFKDLYYDDNMFHQLQSLFSFLSLAQSKAYSLLPFCYSYKDFSGNPTDVFVQHDADEFLKVVVDKVETVCKGKLMMPAFESVFGGKLANIIICQGCGAEKSKDEIFLDLSLEVKGMENLDDSLNQFIEPERINDYLCDNCGNRCDILKKTLIKNNPNVLVIYLKKIFFDLEELVNKKLHTRFEFPHELDIGKYHPDQKTCEYQLTGVVIHRGNADFGHYTSLINVDKIPGGRWVEFDDANVADFNMDRFDSECYGSEDVAPFYTPTGAVEGKLSKSAYILVYEKKIKEPVHFKIEPSSSEWESLKKLISQTDNLNISSTGMIVNFDNFTKTVPDILGENIIKSNLQLQVIGHLSNKHISNFVLKTIEDVGLYFNNNLINFDNITLNDNVKKIEFGFLYLIRISLRDPDAIYVKDSLEGLIKIFKSIETLVNNNTLTNLNSLLESLITDIIMPNWKDFFAVLCLHTSESIREALSAALSSGMLVYCSTYNNTNENQDNSIFNIQRMV